MLNVPLAVMALAAIIVVVNITVNIVQPFSGAAVRYREVLRVDESSLLE